MYDTLFVYCVFGLLTVIYAKRTLQYTKCIYIEKCAAEYIIQTTLRPLPNSDWKTFFSKEAAVKIYKRLKLISLLDQNRSFVPNT